MYNQMFYITQLEEKQNKLKRVLRGKIPFISNIHLNEIINAVNFDKQYTIKVTSNINKFENIVVNEKVETSSMNFCSFSTPIYGDVKSGLFENYYGTIKKKSEQSNPLVPKAAIKEIHEKKNKKIITSYHLVVYHPPKQLLKIS